MTILVALHDPKLGTWIGSDRRITKDGGIVYLDMVDKWCELGSGYWVGVSGDYRTLNLIACEAVNGRMSDLKGGFDFTRRVRRLYEEHDWRVKADGYGAPCYGSSFILAMPKAIWSISTDLSIIDVTDRGFFAEGSGERYAFGADFVARSVLCPEERVRTAIKAACAHDAGCGGEIFVKHLPIE